MLLTGRIPKHAGIIMDGNGRWAESRGLPRVEGHRRGVERTKEVVEVAAELGLKVLTLYAFSTENWLRPNSEVTTLMKLLELYLKRELGNLVKNNVVFKTIGDIWRLPEDIQKVIRETEEKTSLNKGMILVAAWSYSGRNEILRAVKKVLCAGIKPEDLTEEIFSSYLDTAALPSPDLIIRTGGEMRISNFLIWQGAYSELYFTDTLWPDFTKDEFLFAIQDYQRRERRFGAISLKADAP
ncbi:MAG: di-trans,poly-cis-decaprenylcistransferase [Nitrospirae bacterium RBG_13_39_12]|nr:MAG: di-trans,poly-cis-decaprenylcistransferase [Nitrospirae bacterium RBG_13_39_12]